MQLCNLFTDDDFLHRFIATFLDTCTVFRYLFVYSLIFNSFQFIFHCLATDCILKFLVSWNTNAKNSHVSQTGELQHNGFLYMSLDLHVQCILYKIMYE